MSVCDNTVCMASWMSCSGVCSIRCTNVRLDVVVVSKRSLGGAVGFVGLGGTTIGGGEALHWYIMTVYETSSSNVVTASVFRELGPDFH